MEPYYDKGVYPPRRPSTPVPTATPARALQTFRAVVIPSPPTAAGSEPQPINADAVTSVNQVPQLKRKLSSSAPQNPYKKSYCPSVILPNAYDISSAASRDIVVPGLSIDCKLLLLSLADQYIQAGRASSGIDPRDRCKLIATALGCLETVIKEKQAWKLHPRQEASIMLKYCTLLHEETDNDAQAETMLSRGIILCDRHRFYDLKYSMQYLAVRYMFKKSPPKVMEAYVGNIIEDAERLGHTVWVYAFLFLRVSLLLSLPSKSYTGTILRDLATVTQTAKRRDPSVGALAATLVALVHIRARTNNWLSDAQHALATARSQQLSASRAGLSEVETTIYILDIACSLDPYDPRQAGQKMQAMHEYFKSIPQTKKNHNILSIPLGSQDFMLTLETAGAFERPDNGQLHLLLAWLSPQDLYALGLLVSGLAYWYKNPRDRQSDVYFRNCLKSLQSTSVHLQLGNDKTLAPPISTRLQLYVILYQGLAEADREEWHAAIISHKTFLANIRICENALESNTKRILTSISAYLEAIIAQGTGDLEKAIFLYTTTPLALPSYTVHELANPTTILSLLSSINTLLIVHPPSHPQHSHIPSIIDRLKHYFAQTTPYAKNAHLLAAFIFAQSVILSTTPHPSAVLNISSPSPNTPTLSLHQILPTKQLLQRSLNLSKSVGNKQLLAMTLTFVHHAFFNGQVGEQALHAASSARNTAMESGRRLWAATCDGVVGGVMERMGMREEAEKMFENGRRVELTEALQRL